MIKNNPEVVCRLKKIENESEYYAASYVIEWFGGCEENPITVNFRKDGGISMWGDEDLLFLYPEQIELLKVLLETI